MPSEDLMQQNIEGSNNNEAAPDELASGGRNGEQKTHYSHANQTEHYVHAALIRLSVI